ncbi:hypothetical protein AB4Y89_15335 [Terriglobus sp. 2YAB30_2]|uniref:hypothetical protein n=1 Tax=unclassified Terriglobus TaxID=2628988 RepID=UPI003F994A13
MTGFGQKTISRNRVTRRVLRANIRQASETPPASKPESKGQPNELYDFSFFGLWGSADLFNAFYQANHAGLASG